MFALWVVADKRFAFSPEDNGGSPLTSDEHQALLDGQAKGLTIVKGKDGRPTLEPRKELPLTAAQVQVLRQSAYAAESDSLFLEWQFDKSAKAEQIWRDKVTEIKERYPLP